jgi:RNA polymerase sigma factor (sigma-70 family)
VRRGSVRVEEAERAEVPSPSEEAQVVPTWEEVARLHGSFLYTLAYRLTADHQDAQDLVQETLLRVRKGLPTYRPGSLHGWLTRIATNVFIDRARRRQRRPEAPLPEDPDAALPAAPAAEETALATSMDDRLQQALMALPEDFRLPIVLCDVADRSYEEIAQTLGIPLGTVRSRIHRGRSMLRGMLG